MTNNRRLPWIVTIVVVTVIAMFGVGWLLASGGGRTDASPGSVPPSGPPASGAASPASDGPSGPDDQQAGGSGQDGSQGGSQDGSGSDSGEQQGGPTIETFRVVQEPRCPGGTDVYAIEGRPVTLEWTVTGADEVTLSIDGPGVYATYPAESSDTITFPCGGEEGDTQEHTYLLTAVADGITRTETLVVTATVHEVTDVG